MAAYVLLCLAVCIFIIIVKIGKKIKGLLINKILYGALFSTFSGGIVSLIINHIQASGI